MAEYIKSICRNCYHSYVCEKFNKYRDENNPDCHFANDHFVPAADVVEVVRCKDCKWTDNVLFKNKVIWCDHDENWVEEDNFCKYGSRRGSDADNRR